MNNRKRKVADMALKLFVEKGIQQTSIQEIIDKAKISKGTFYNYFSSKNDCVADILEFLRYDASQQRIEMQMGKDMQDREVFIEQITLLIRLNQERNLHALFEDILSSSEPELKKLVMQHRFIEMEWLSNRLTDLMGSEFRECSFEGTVLFFGMLQHMLFTLRVTNSKYSIRQLVDSVLSYVELIMPQMLEKGTCVLDPSAIELLRSNVKKKVVTCKEIEDMAHHLKEHYSFNGEQQDLFDAIMDELQREKTRKVVLQQLLKPFQQLFIDTPAEHQIRTFTTLIWYYLKPV